MVRLFDGSPWFIPREIAVLFAGALLALIVDAFLFAYVIDSVESNARAIQAARLQIDQLVAAKDLLQDAETGQRGFLLTGDEQYLQPWNSATALMPQRLESLRTVVSERLKLLFSVSVPLVLLVIAQLPPVVRATLPPVPIVIL